LIIEAITGFLIFLNNEIFNKTGETIIKKSLLVALLNEYIKNTNLQIDAFLNNEKIITNFNLLQKGIKTIAEFSKNVQNIRFKEKSLNKRINDLKVTKIFAR